MAITITQTPQEYEPIYNEIITAASSTNTAQPEFNYLFDVYINGSATKAARYKVKPEPSNLYGYVDIHRIIEDFCTSQFYDINDVDGATALNDSFISYEIKIGESYETAPDVITEFPDLDTTGDLFAFNGSLPTVDLNGGTDRVNFDHTDYLTNFAGNRLLTNMPRTRKVFADEFGFVSWLRNTSGNGERVKVETFDSAGAPINTFEFDLQTVTLSITEGRFINAPILPASLNLVDNSNFNLGTQPIITASVSTYTITINDKFSLQNSEPLYFEIVKNCSEHQRQALHFLNRLGGFDSKSFTLVHEDSANLKKENVKALPDRLTAAGAWVRSTNDRFKKQYYTKSSTMVKLTSNWITDEESRWLLELFESPEIYLERDGVTYAVQGIKQTSYKEGQSITGDMVNIELDIELGTDNTRQRY